MRLQLNQWSGKFDKTKYLHKVFVWSLPCVCNVCVCLSLDNALNRMYWNYCHMKIAIVENAVKILRASISQQTRPVARMAIKLNLLFFFPFPNMKVLHVTYDTVSYKHQIYTFLTFKSPFEEMNQSEREYHTEQSNNNKPVKTIVRLLTWFEFSAIVGQISSQILYMWKIMGFVSNCWTTLIFFIFALFFLVSLFLEMKPI